MPSPGWQMLRFVVIINTYFLCISVATATLELGKNRRGAWERNHCTPAQKKLIGGVSGRIPPPDNVTNCHRRIAWDCETAATSTICSRQLRVGRLVVQQLLPLQ